MFCLWGKPFKGALGERFRFVLGLLGCLLYLPYSTKVMPNYLKLKGICHLFCVVDIAFISYAVFEIAITYIFSTIKGWNLYHEHCC